jgi:hypothetical protein
MNNLIFNLKFEIFNKNGEGIGGIFNSQFEIFNKLLNN